MAVSPELGGLIEVDAEVAAVVEAAGRAMADAGAHVRAGQPDLTLAEDTFRTLRAWTFQAGFRDLLAEHPDEFKPSLADNIRAGEHLTGADVARAYEQLTALGETARLFFHEYDVLVLPTSQVPPFPADQEYPADINGKPMATYLDWMRSAYFITVTGCPAISVPAGTTRDGLPVGVQIVAAARRRPAAAGGRCGLRGRSSGSTPDVEHASERGEIGEGPRQYECQGPSLTAVVTQRSPHSRSGPGPAVTREPRRPKPPCEPSPS